MSIGTPLASVKIDPLFWIGVFALISLVALIEYALSNWKQWGWLFPAGVFGGLALVLGLLTRLAAVGLAVTMLGAVSEAAAVWQWKRSRIESGFFAPKRSFMILA